MFANAHSSNAPWISLSEWSFTAYFSRFMARLHSTGTWLLHWQHISPSGSYKRKLDCLGFGIFQRCTPCRFTRQFILVFRHEESTCEHQIVLNSGLFQGCTMLMSRGTTSSHNIKEDGNAIRTNGERPRWITPYQKTSIYKSNVQVTKSQNIPVK
jgi:hypothetical protein